MFQGIVFNAYTFKGSLPAAPAIPQRDTQHDELVERDGMAMTSEVWVVNRPNHAKAHLPGTPALPHASVGSLDVAGKP